MAVRKVIQIGHPALKAINQPLTDFGSPFLKKLIKDLKDTMKKAGLIGIASPQIAKNYQIFLTHVRKTKTRKLEKIDKLRVYINPQITYFSETKSMIYEGCGSVAYGKLFAPVKRPKEIKIEAYDEKGKKFSLLTDGILSRVIQHEYDHLQGIEFIEKIADYKKILSEEYYLKKIKNSKEQKLALRTTKIEIEKAYYDQS